MQASQNPLKDSYNLEDQKNDVDNINISDSDRSVEQFEDDHAYFNEISPSDFNVQNQRYDQEFYKQMPATTKNGSNGKQFQTLGEGGNPQAASYNLFKTTNKQLVGNLTQQDESKESITIDPKADKNQFTYKTLDQQKSANAKKKAKDIQRGNYVFESGSSIPSSSNIRSNQAHHHLPPSQQQPKEELIGQLPVEDDKEGQYDQALIQLMKGNQGSESKVRPFIS